jgi:hypothetical protein
VIVVATSIVLVPSPILELFVDFGHNAGDGEVIGLNVVATEYDAGVVTKTSPMPAQKPPRADIVEYTLGSAV